MYFNRPSYIPNREGSGKIIDSEMRENKYFWNLMWLLAKNDRLCGLVVRVSGYRYRGPGFDPRRYQIFWVVVGLERVHSTSWASWGQLRSYLNAKSAPFFAQHWSCWKFLFERRFVLSKRFTFRSSFFIQPTFYVNPSALLVHVTSLPNRSNLSYNLQKTLLFIAIRSSHL